MKKQSIKCDGCEKGLFYILSKSVKELEEIAEKTDGEISVITIRDGGHGGNFEKYGTLVCSPAEWQSVCQAEIDENPESNDWDTAEETQCNEDCRKHHLCVTLSAQEWGIDKGMMISRWQCPECGQWHPNEEDARGCCD